MLRTRLLSLPLCAFLAAAAMISCSTRHQLHTPVQLKTLPMSGGFNHGSLVAPTPWLYLGSKEETHEFRYYFSKEGVLCHHLVSIPKSSTLLEFPEFAYKAKQSWVALMPDQKTFRFTPSPSANPAL
jgi:hypothetical protein